jgi:hypothetical protein
MKKLINLLFCCAIVQAAQAQETNDYRVERACLNYLEGFYEGDTAKLISCLKPGLYKFGYWKNQKTGKYEADGQMTYRQALDYAKRVWEKKNFAKPGAPKKVEVLHLMNTIAAAKVTAWWGVDYVLLAKQGEEWMIEQVLWEGPLATK